MMSGVVHSALTESTMAGATVSSESPKLIEPEQQQYVTMFDSMDDPYLQEVDERDLQQGQEAFLASHYCTIHEDYFAVQPPPADSVQPTCAQPSKPGSIISACCSSSTWQQSSGCATSISNSRRSSIVSLSSTASSTLSSSPGSSIAPSSVASHSSSITRSSLSGASCLSAAFGRKQSAGSSSSSRRHGTSSLCVSSPSPSQELKRLLSSCKAGLKGLFSNLRHSSGGRSTSAISSDCCDGFTHTHGCRAAAASAAVTVTHRSTSTPAASRGAAPRQTTGCAQPCWRSSTWRHPYPGGRRRWRLGWQPGATPATTGQHPGGPATSGIAHAVLLPSTTLGTECRQQQWQQPQQAWDRQCVCE